MYRTKLGDILKLEDTELHLVQRKNAHKKLAETLSGLVILVQCVSGGDAQIILSTGFDIRKQRSKAHLRPAPIVKQYTKLPQ